MLLQPPRFQGPLEPARATLSLGSVSSAAEIVKFIKVVHERLVFQGLHPSYAVSMRVTGLIISL